MKPPRKPAATTHDLFRSRLENMIDMRHGGPILLRR